MLNFLTSALDKVIELAKQFALFAVVIIGLWLLGSVIYDLQLFNYLTPLFVFARRLLLLFDFMNDSQAMFTVIGLSLQLLVAYFTFKAYMSVTQFFNNK